MPAVTMINTRKMRYTGDAISALNASEVNHGLKAHSDCHDSVPSAHKNGTDNDKGTYLPRSWSETQCAGHRVASTERTNGTLHRNLGDFPMTAKPAAWISSAIANHNSDQKTLEVVGPYAAEFHALVDRERKSSSGLHDLDVMELTYQVALEIGAAILVAADATDNPMQLQDQYHTSHAARDDHFSAWGKLLTGLECDPPIIVQFPFYLMMCQSFTFEPTGSQEDYVYSALTGVDWAKGSGNKFSERLRAFETLATSSVPTLDDKQSGRDRCFWRLALAYLRAMNECENAREFKTPKGAAISTDLDPDLIIFARGIDTIGEAFMCSDGASFYDDKGIDSLIGSGLSNDVMDLDCDIRTGETRNLLRLLYPSGLTLDQALQTTSIVLSGQLCEVFRAHHRARLGNREDGRVSATSPPYSFCRARHRRIFETLELYTRAYPQFWEWTWDLYRRTKDQVTEAGVCEPLVCALKRAGTRAPLEPSAATKFYHLYWEMVEDGSEQLANKTPLGVSADLAPTIRDIHSLWHSQLLDESKKPGWGREFDEKSDTLFGEAGKILQDRSGISEDMYKFAIAYGRLSMGLPYIAYHTVDAIIMAFGIVDGA